MSFASFLEKVVLGISDPGTLALKLFYRDLVSFNLCCNLKRFSRTEGGQRVSLIIDVGANHGQFAFMAKYCWPEVRVESVEPDPEAVMVFRRNHGRNGSIRIHECALVSQEAPVKLNLHRDSAQNSILRQDGLEYYAEREVTGITLDKLASELWLLNSAKAPKPLTLLKLDVQGFELGVLEGASSFLTSVGFVLVELSLADLFENGSQIEDVWRFLRHHGFKYTSLMDTYYSHELKEVTQMDVLFSNVNN